MLSFRATCWTMKMATKMIRKLNGSIASMILPTCHVASDTHSRETLSHACRPGSVRHHRISISAERLKNACQAFSFLRANVNELQCDRNGSSAGQRSDILGRRDGHGDCQRKRSLSSRSILDPSSSIPRSLNAVEKKTNWADIFLVATWCSSRRTAIRHRTRP